MHICQLTEHKTDHKSEADPSHHSKDSLFTRAGLAQKLQQARASFSTQAISVDFITLVVAKLLAKINILHYVSKIATM
jgi:hypothetical protein